MPYTAEILPDFVKKMPAELKDAWLKAFNASFETYKGDEGKAMATANSMIGKMGYRKNKDGEYVKAERNMDVITSPIMFSIPEGKKFIKEVVYEGNFVHPETKKPLKLTVERFKEWIKNFKNKLVDVCYVPLNHSTNPADNTGFIEDLFIADSENNPGKKGLFAKYNIILDDISSKIGRTILGDSIGIERYFSPETGEDMGEILSHIALTNDQYIQNLGEFKAVAFSKGENVNITNYVFERQSKDKSREDKTMVMTEQEILELKTKNLELEKKAKEADEKAEMSRKEKEFGDKKIAEMEKASFEREVTSEIDKLVLSKKILPADKEAETKFAISLGRAKGMEYINDRLAKRADVVEMGSKAAGGVDKDAGTGEKPKLSELTGIWIGWLTHKYSKETAFKLCKAWEDKFNLAKSHVDDRDTSVKFTRHKDW
jgi:cation transport regulator ChaB